MKYWFFCEREYLALYYIRLFIGINKKKIGVRKTRRTKNGSFGKMIFISATKLYFIFIIKYFALSHRRRPGTVDSTPNPHTSTYTILNQGRH